MQDREQENKSPRHEFNTNREKIKQFFEANISKNTTERNTLKKTTDTNLLKNRLAEFFSVQHNFHQKMSNMVEAFKDARQQLPKDTRCLLNDLLKPYSNLEKNHFDGPTGDVEKDITHIMEVINKRNEQFQEELSAILESVSNLVLFYKLLKGFEKNEDFVNQLKKNPNFTSWLQVQGSIDSPFQNLIKCELLLKALQKHLIEICENLTETSPASENLLEKLNESIGYLLPEIKNINDNKDIIAFLNKINRFLEKMLANEISKQEAITKDDNDAPNLKAQIESTMLSLKTGKNKIIKGKNQDICSLLHGLFDLLKGIEETYSQALKVELNYTLSSALSYAISYLPTLFRPQDNLKLELQEIINELSDTIVKAEALKDIQEILLKKNQLQNGNRV